MEALEFDGPRGPLEPVGKLAVEPDELEERLGLRFGPVRDGLGPAVLAAARLADGGVVVFARLLNSPWPGTEVWLVGPRRRAQEVVDALLAETGLGRDLVLQVVEDDHVPGDGPTG